jgi:hypothetical protein
MVSSQNTPIPKVGERYVHHKRKTVYRVVFISAMENDGEIVVSYVTDNKPESVPFARTLDNFSSFVDRSGIRRFTLVDNKDEVQKAAERGYNGGG